MDGFNAVLNRAMDADAGLAHKERDKREMLLHARSAQLTKLASHHVTANRGGKKVRLPPCLAWFIGAAFKGEDAQTSLQILLTITPAGHIWITLQALLSVALFAMFVCATYDVNIPFWLEIGAAAVLVIDYGVQGFAAQDRWKFPFTFFAVIDALCVIPIVIKSIFAKEITSALYGGTFTGLYFLRLFRLERIVRVLNKYVPVFKDEINAILALCVIQIVALMLVSAGLVYTVEEELYAVFSDAKTPRYALSSAEPKHLDYLTCIYFVIVTLSTVGFGDISPDTQLGRILVTGMIGVNLITIPAMVNKVLALIQARSKYRLHYKPVANRNHSHIILAGRAPKDAAVLNNFFSEFFHSDRSGMNSNDAMREVLVFGHDDPEEDVRIRFVLFHIFQYIMTVLSAHFMLLFIFLCITKVRVFMAHPNIRARGVYIRGTVMQEEDMSRIAAGDAHACFIIADKEALNSALEDEANIIRALVARNFNDKLRTFVQLLRPESVSLLGEDEVDTAICTGELKMQLLAGATNCLGINTLFDNLCTHTARDMNVDRVPWMDEYVRGYEKEMYSIEVPDVILGISTDTHVGAALPAVTIGELPWDEVLLAVYKATHGNVNVVGVVVRGVTTIHPGMDFILPAVSGSVSLIVLADDWVSAMTLTDPKLYRGQQMLAESSVVACDTIRPFCPILPKHAFPFDDGAKRATQHDQFAVAAAAAKVAKEGGGGEETTTTISPALRRLKVMGGKVGKQAIALRNFASGLGRGEQDENEAGRPASKFDTAHPQRNRWGLLKPGYGLNEIEDARAFGIQGHVVVTGAMESVEHMVHSLRLPKFYGTVLHKPILLLHPFKRGDAADNAELRSLRSKLTSYRDVFLLRGDPSAHGDLERAALVQASCCILLANRREIVEIDGDSLSVRTIYTYLSIEQFVNDKQSKYSSKLMQHFYVVVELASASTMRILNAKRLERFAVAIERHDSGTSKSRRSQIQRDPARAMSACFLFPSFYRSFSHARTHLSLSLSLSLSFS